MRLTQLVETVNDTRWQCNVCQWRCVLSPAEMGRCLVRVGTADGISVQNDGLISAAVVGMVEDYRLWHAFPGTRVLALGGWGYAFPADQQRGQYGQVPEDERQQRRLAPERAAAFALERLCRGVVWSFSDPSVSQEYVLEVLQLSRASSRYTALVTSGYATTTAIDQIGHYLDAISLELRGFDDQSYNRLAGVEQWRGILETAAHAKTRWGCHVEVTTRIHPGVNDAPEVLSELAGWIREALGVHTAWHLLPGDAGAAAAASVSRARRVAHENGLHFIYGADPYQNTLCPTCGTVLVERSEAGTRLVKLSDGRCSTCDEKIDIRTSIFKS